MKAETSRISLADGCIQSAQQAFQVVAVLYDHVYHLPFSLQYPLCHQHRRAEYHLFVLVEYLLK